MLFPSPLVGSEQWLELLESGAVRVFLNKWLRKVQRQRNENGGTLDDGVLPCVQWKRVSNGTMFGRPVMG